MSLPIGITMGDPSGIGPELIAKLFQEGDLAAAAVVIGDRNIMERAARIVGAPVLIRCIGHPREALRRPGVIDVICETELPADLASNFVSVRALAPPPTVMWSAPSNMRWQDRCAPSSPRL